MADKLRVGTLEANRGTKISGFLPVSGMEFQIPVTVVNGAVDGPRLAVTGGIHGAEYPGIEAACRLARALDPRHVKGSVIVVHMANPPAFFSRSIYVGPLDGKNLNRVFPGDSEGTASDRIADVIFKEVILGSDYYVDLHGGDMIEKLVPFTIFCGDAEPGVVETSRAMATAYGLPFAIASKGKGNTYGTAARAGIPSILAEAGGLGILDEESVRAHLEGLESLLRFTGSVDADAEPSWLSKDVSSRRLSQQEHADAKTTVSSGDLPPKQVKVLGSFPYLNSDTRGMLYLSVDVKDRVAKGQHVGVIKDYFGNVVRDLQAPETGIVLFKVTSLAINPGDPILALGTE